MSLVEKILEILQGQAEGAAELIDIVLSDRSTSYRKARRSLLRAPQSFKTDWASAYRQRRVFYATLNRLKRQGLVVERKSGKRSVWKITQQGLKRWGFLMDRRGNPFSLWNMDLANEPTKPGITIVAFDIPEREKFKRRWLRGCLKSLEFSMLQKSVWIGKRRLPEKFIRALREEDTLRSVQIFGISKTGTIEETE